MKNEEVSKLVDVKAIEDKVLKAAGNELKDLVDKYGIDLVAKQFEIEEWSKKLGEYLVSQDIEKRLGNSYQNKYGEVKRTGGADLKTFGITQRFVDFSYKDIREGMKELIVAVTTPKKGVAPSYYSTLKEVISVYNNDTDKVIDLLTSISTTVALECVISQSTLLSNNIAQLIADELQEEAKTEKLFTNLPKESVKNIEKGLGQRVGRHFKTYYVKHSLEKHKIMWRNWKEATVTTVGTVLLDIVISRCCYFEQKSPLVPSDKNPRMNLEVHASPTLIEAWGRNTKAMIKRAGRFCPTVIPPRKWTAFDDGGYYGTLAGRASLLRLQERLSHEQKTTFHSRYRQQLEQTDISPVLEAINAIQETPWQVNKQVLDVLIYSNNNNKAWGDTPYFEPEPKPIQLVGDYTEKELKAHKKKLVEYYKRETRRISKCLRLRDIEYTATEYSQYDKIYFPHNMDFRGRVYPIFPTLSPQGDDVGKSLIKFADAPPITDESQLKYFYIQGANVAGQDKKTLDERINWVMKNNHNILTVASDPLVNLWWAEQDEPWQFLAFCFEYKSLQDYKNEHNGSAIGWVTGLPFAQDGSCSGIQHYSAASLDVEGGKAVNLVPQDKPNDIYGYYAGLVNKVLEKDAMNGTPDKEETFEQDEEEKTKITLGTKSLAQRWLAFGVTRKVTKRPVMTLPYGATAGGYKMQILEDTIKPALENGTGAVFDGFKMQMAVYLAKVISSQVAGLNAVKYMDWLRKVTKLITKGGNVVTWMTPLGLPVQQTYMKYNTVTLKLRINGTVRRMYYKEVTGNIDNTGQKQGTPPNFIHSMDACHLQMTVLAAYKQGVRHFAMIHDSYGSPIQQAGIMWNTVREQFVKMYSENDIFGQFLENAKLYIKNETDIPPLPPKGNLNLKEIKNSLYAFC